MVVDQFNLFAAYVYLLKGLRPYKYDFILFFSNSLVARNSLFKMNK
jgi:hypothetical protein